MTVAVTETANTERSWRFAEGDEFAPGRHALQRLGGRPPL